MIIRFALPSLALFLVFALLIPVPGLAQDEEKPAAKPIPINDPVPEPVKNFALTEDSPADATTSPNPRLDMTILDGEGQEVVNAIPMMEDAETDFFANSEIFGANPPEAMDGMIFAKARWLKAATVMWTIDEVRRGRSSLGNSNSHQYRAGFKDPGEYLLSCFAYRDFAYEHQGQEARLTAISSRGIACFVADATPPAFALKFTEYKTAKRSTISLLEVPPDVPVGSKSWELFFDGVHFDPAGVERKSGRLRGPLDREARIDLSMSKDILPLVIKKGMTYLLSIEGQDNYLVDKAEWMLLNPEKKNLFDSANVQKFQLTADAAFEGNHVLMVFLQDKGGNNVEVRVPVRIVAP